MPACRHCEDTLSILWGEVQQHGTVSCCPCIVAVICVQEFEGYDTNADWVASITSLSGALNGTTRVYIDGLQ